jgi:hypothetical protein
LEPVGCAANDLNLTTEFVSGFIPCDIFSKIGNTISYEMMIFAFTGRAMAEFLIKHSIINFLLREAPAFSRMDQRFAFLFLRMKGLSAMTIHREFLEVLGSNRVLHGDKIPPKGEF